MTQRASRPAFQGWAIAGVPGEARARLGTGRGPPRDARWLWGGSLHLLKTFSSLPFGETGRPRGAAPPPNLRRPPLSARGQPEDMSPKFPEIFKARGTLVFAGSPGACAPPPWASVASVRPGGPRPQPGIRLQGPALAPPHSLASASPRTASSVSDCNSRPRPNFPFGIGVRFSQGEEAGWGPRVSTGRRQRAAPVPTVASPPRALASRGRARGSPGKPLSLMRPGAFVLLSLPPLRSCKDCGMTKWGWGGGARHVSRQSGGDTAAWPEAGRGKAGEGSGLRPGHPCHWQARENQEALAGFHPANQRGL